MLKCSQLWFFCLLRKCKHDDGNDVNVLERAGYDRWIAMERASVILGLDGLENDFPACEELVFKDIKRELKKYNGVSQLVDMDFFRFMTEDEAFVDFQR